MPAIHVDNRQVAASVGQAIENALYSVMRRATRYDDLLAALNNKFREHDVHFAIVDGHRMYYVYVQGRRLEFDSEIDAILAAVEEYTDQHINMHVRAALANAKQPGSKNENE